MSDSYRRVECRMSLSSCRSSCVGSSLFCCRSCRRLAESDSCRECLRSSIVVSCFRRVAACLMLGRNLGLLLSPSPSRRPRSLRRFDVSWCLRHHHVALEAYDVLMVLGMSSSLCRSAPDANQESRSAAVAVVRCDRDYADLRRSDGAGAGSLGMKSRPSSASTSASRQYCANGSLARRDSLQ